MLEQQILQLQIEIEDNKSKLSFEKVLVNKLIRK